MDLADIKKAMDVIIEHEDVLDLVEDAIGYGLCNGGCGIFAQALKLWIPEGTIVTILVDDETERPEHYGLLFEGHILDGLGVHRSDEAWIYRMEQEWPDWDGRMTFEDTYIPAENIECSPVNSAYRQYEEILSIQLNHIARTVKIMER